MKNKTSALKKEIKFIKEIYEEIFMQKYYGGIFEKFGLSIIRRTREADKKEIERLYQYIDLHKSDFDNILELQSKINYYKKFLKDNIKTEGALALVENYVKVLKEKESNIKKLERKINCVKNHPELKPINCCYQADTLEYKSYKEIAENKIKELEKDRTHFKALARAGYVTLQEYDEKIKNIKSETKRKDNDNYT